MPDFFGQSFDDPRTQGILAAAASLLQSSGSSPRRINIGEALGRGLSGGLGAYQNAQEGQLKADYVKAQTQGLLSTAAERQAHLDAAKRKQDFFAGLGGQPAGLLGAAPQNQPLPMEMFSQGQGAQPPEMFSQPPAMRNAFPSASAIQQPAQGQQQNRNAGLGNIDAVAALRAGYSPDEITKLAGLNNLGKPKVARTIKGLGPDNKEYEYQVDELGQRVGDGFAQFRAPISVNQGNRTTFADPYNLQPVANFQTFQSPDSVASNATTQRGQNMTDARARDATARASADGAKPPAGYRQTADGNLEFIPGGPADPSKKDPTEFQGKSATYGARAEAADKVLNGVSGSYSPFMVNAKISGEQIPGVGGILGTGANALMSANSQKVEQAQRNFINAVLRQESGAAIAPAEFENARKQYFPEPLDKPEKIAQKAANRALAIEGFRNSAGRGAFTPTAASPAAPAAPKVIDALPTANTSNKGQRIRDTSTGKVLVSNGIQWKEE